MWTVPVPSERQAASSVSPVDVRKDGSAAWLTLCRPPANKLDLELTLALHRALVEADDDTTVRAIVLTGSASAFCGGADLPAVTAAGELHAFSDALVELFGVFPELRTPVVAAVNGDALAGGFGLLCSADVVIAVEDANVGTIEAQFGSWPVVAQVAALRRAPFPALMSNVLTGVPLPAARAEQLGIVDEVVSADALDHRVRALAEAVTAAGDSIAIGRPALYRAATLPYREALRAGADAFVALAEGREPRE
jgi:enoyl-CoA hydratase/carnithine racemase